MPRVWMGGLEATIQWVWERFCTTVTTASGGQFQKVFSMFISNLRRLRLRNLTSDGLLNYRLVIFYCVMTIWALMSVLALSKLSHRSTHRESCQWRPSGKSCLLEAMELPPPKEFHALQAFSAPQELYALPIEERRAAIKLLGLKQPNAMLVGQVLWRQSFPELSRFSAKEVDKIHGSGGLPSEVFDIPGMPAPRESGERFSQVGMSPPWD